MQKIRSNHSKWIWRERIEEILVKVGDRQSEFVSRAIDSIGESGRKNNFLFGRSLLIAINNTTDKIIQIE